MKTTMIAIIWCICAFGMMLSVRRAVESYKISDWWGVLGQTIMITVAIAFGIIATLMTFYT